MSASKVVRNFSSILDSIKNKEKAKIAVMRKNKLEAIILSIDEYERIHEIIDLFDHLQIYKTVEQRKIIPLEEYIDFEQILADQGLNYDEI
ncbi:MAG: hypothetical protein B6230_05760 [Desulfobacteraceae bacterium 4572_89]|nr:MAG: hypothetical protein B6230_05760 [Desulfobacteraceae bacterium 4572_89]